MTAISLLILLALNCSSFFPYSSKRLMKYLSRPQCFCLLDEVFVHLGLANGLFGVEDGLYTQTQIIQSMKYLTIKTLHYKTQRVQIMTDMSTTSVPTFLGLLSGCLPCALP